MSRPLLQVLAPVFMWALLCGFAAAGAVLALYHESLFALVVMRAALAGAVYQTTLEWQRAAQALAARRSAPYEVPAVPHDLQ